MRKLLMPLLALATVLAATGCSSGGAGDASKPVDPAAGTTAPPAGSRNPVGAQ